jgi:flagellar protein FliS
MSSLASTKFLADRVMTATPAQRVVMLYDRAILDVHRATAASAGGDPVAASEHVMHALAIVAELRSVLDLTQWDGAAQLSGLYQWVMGRLIECRTGDAEQLAVVVEVLTTLRSAWQQAAEEVATVPRMTLGAAV